MVADGSQVSEDKVRTMRNNANAWKCERPDTNRFGRFGTNYVWLLYSVFFFIDPFLRRSGRYWIQCLAIFAVFLGIYIWCIETKRPQIQVYLVGLIWLLGVATIHFNSGGNSFFIFAAAMLPFVVPSMRMAAWLIAGEVALLGVEWMATGGNRINFAMTAAFACAVGAGNIFIADRKRAGEALRAAQQENVALAAVAERERIARDLHDVLGHTLSVIVLKAELAKRLVGKDDARAAIEIADVERTARTALAEVREAIGGYRSKGLSAEVEQARRTLDAAGVALTCESEPPALEAREETVLSLVLREAVTNIVRHAQATRCTMRFATTADGFASFEVEDNGQTRILGEGRAREGNGLRGMRERVQELGGRFRIEAERGTKLVIELPGNAGMSVR